MSYMKNMICDLEYCQTVSLDTIFPKCVPQAPAYCPVKACVKKSPSAKEQTMNTIQITNDTDSNKRGYLERRLYDIKDEKMVAARDTYNLNDMDSPSTPKEMADRITAGLFEIKGLDTKADQKFGWNGWAGAMHWRDPAKKADKVGFDAFQTKVEAAAQTVEDTIAILPAADALKALQDFEAATFS